MPPEHTGEDTYTFFIYLIYKSYTVRLFLRKYFPKPEEYACKALEKSKNIVQIICFFNLQLCTLYNSFVLSVQCYRVKCRMYTNTLANFVQSYYYTQRKKTKPTEKGEGAESIQQRLPCFFHGAQSFLRVIRRCEGARSKGVRQILDRGTAADPAPARKPYPCRKEEKQMNKLTQALMEELTVEYVKVGSLQIPESVVISWVIMLLLVVGSILLTRNLKVDHISKRQAALEALYSLGKNFFEGLLGKEGSRYVPYLMTVALYIACSNVIGVFGVKPPTKDLDVTAALALMSIVLIEYAGVRARGGAGFLKSLAAPTPIMTPMNILEIAIRPTSLCMRLFGNVLGAFVIMELLKLVVPVFVPAVFSLYFDLFDGLIQTYVFVFLTALFMKESIGGEE